MVVERVGDYFERHLRRIASCRGDLGVALWESQPEHEREREKTTNIKEGTHEEVSREDQKDK